MSALRDPAYLAQIGRAEAADRAKGVHYDNPEKGVTSPTSLFAQGGDGWPAPISKAASIGVAGEFVRIVEPHSEADPAALLLSFLVAIGNAIGDGPHARVEGDKHPARLNAVIVGETSHGRKGTSWGRVREPLVFAFPDYEDRIVSGLSSGEGVIHHVRDPDPLDNEDDDRQLDRRLLVVEGEFAQALKAASRNGNTLSAVLRNLWDSGNVRVLTRNSPLRATGAHVSIVAHITLEELRAELTASDTSNGFSNRFLWICARRSKLLPDGGNLDRQALMPVCEQLDALSSWAAAPRLLKRDQEATDLWHNVYPGITTGHPGAFGKVTSRAEAQVLRLSVLYASLDRSTAITVNHLQAALGVWQYAQESARVIFGHSVGNRDADRILQALKGRPEGLTQTEISELFDRHISAESKDNALRVIADRVEVVKEQTGGRPRELVRLRREVSEVSEGSQERLAA